MAEGSIPEHQGEDASRVRGSQPTLTPFKTSTPFPAPRGALNEDADPGLSLQQECGCREPTLDFLWRRKTPRNHTGASLPQIKRGLVRAWRMILALQINEAFGSIDWIELQLGDASPAVSKRFRPAIELLRAAGLAFQDDGLAALAMAASYLRGRGGAQDHHAATLCRFGFWQLGKFDSFYSLPRRRPGARSPKSGTISAVLDLSIEAAMALDHLHFATAKRLASDALYIAETALPAAGGIAALPACLIAQVLYEEGCLDEAEIIIRDRLPAINAEGSIECALRAYLVLTRIARHRMQYDFVALLLREAEALGERREWPRLVAACAAERILLLLQLGRMREARLSVECLDGYVETHRPRSGHSGSEVMRYRMLARWRVCWAEAPSSEAVTTLRLLYHHAVEKKNLYVACQLAVELAEMLAVIGESEEADALFFHMIKSGAVAGLYQVFLEGGAGLGALLGRAYNYAETPGSTDREMLPFLGSLLSRWDARCAKRLSAEPGRRISDVLTTREGDILAMISRGLSNKRIAQSLKISPETVKSHVKRVFLKLGVGTRMEAVSQAKSLGLL